MVHEVVRAEEFSERRLRVPAPITPEPRSKSTAREVGAEIVAHGPSGVPSRFGVRLGDEGERFRRSQIAAHNANA
jgi:hypothetical protein